MIIERTSSEVASCLPRSKSCALSTYVYSTNQNITTKYAPCLAIPFFYYQGQFRLCCFYANLVPKLVFAFSLAPG